MTDRPDPLVPAEVDLRDFAFMPLDVLRLRDSELSATPDAEAFRCAVLSWCVAWHQIPAASLPDDDAALARLLGFGRDLKGWKKVRAGDGLRGWVKCSDGRLYHPVVAEKARDAWQGKLQQRWRTECARIKKHNQRHEIALDIPDFDTWLSNGCPQGQPLPVPKDKQQSPTEVPEETASKGEGKGQGEGQGEEKRVEQAPRPGEPPPPAKPSASAPRGSRLPADWKLPKAWGDWALQERPDWNADHVRKVAEQFRDYWIAQPARDGVKADWEATWRNWVRKETSKPAGGHAPGTSSPAVCCCCGAPGSLKVGTDWYCPQHDQFSERKAA